MLYAGMPIWTQVGAATWVLEVGAATCRWASAGRPRRPCLPLSLNALPCAAPIWPQTDNLCDKAVCPHNPGSVEVGSAGAYGGRHSGRQALLGASAACLLRVITPVPLPCHPLPP